MRETLLSALQRTLLRFCRYPSLQKDLQSLSRPAHIFAIGKAAHQMARQAQRALKPGQVLFATVLTKYGFFPAQPDPAFQPLILEAGHPLPDENSLSHTRFILERLQAIPADESVILLISGGSSALFELPRPPQTLQDITQMNRMLISSGLDILQINRKRRQASLIKGGQAARYLQGKDAHIFVLSDVPGDDPAAIGSGPFYKPDALPHRLIANNQDFLKCLARELHKSFPHYLIRISPRYVDEDAIRWARALARYAQKAKPGIYLFGGECSIKPRGSGQGGRLSHLALTFAQKAAGGRACTLCAFATDGNDHLPHLAGAITDQTSWQQMQDAGSDPKEALINFDSYPALNSAGLIIPGKYTGTNVNDVMILWVK